ncbi:hypothetical protein RUM43_013158 [Polyplax serrata]|uniref:Uncharacterized protein n=1 Tax=Polyplax serrata TaxID=468196 RepID=A0AAN8NQZ1_POLSC
MGMPYASSTPGPPSSSGRQESVRKQTKETQGAKVKGEVESNVEIGWANDTALHGGKGPQPLLLDEEISFRRSSPIGLGWGVETSRADLRDEKNGSGRGGSLTRRSPGTWLGH